MVIGYSEYDLFHNRNTCTDGKDDLIFLRAILIHSLILCNITVQDGQQRHYTRIQDGVDGHFR